MCGNRQAGLQHTLVLLRAGTQYDLTAMGDKVLVLKLKLRAAFMILRKEKRSNIHAWLNQTALFQTLFFS